MRRCVATITTRYPSSDQTLSPLAASTDKIGRTEASIHGTVPLEIRHGDGALQCYMCDPGMARYGSNG